MPRLNESGIENCGFVELVGFNGRADDADLFDGGAYHSPENMLGCVILHGFDWMTEEEEDELSLDNERPTFGACLISCAWDPEDEGQYDRLEPWQQPDWEDMRQEEEMVDRLYAFMDFIRKHDLGTFTLAPAFLNPNHETGVLSAIWIPNQFKLMEWAAKYPPSIEEVNQKLGGW